MTVIAAVEGRPVRAASDFWAITRDKLPLQYGRDTLYVAAEDIWALPQDLIVYDMLKVDSSLRPGEMRLVSR